MEGKNFLYYRLYAIYGELLTEKQAQAIEDYFGLDLSLGEIAEMRGISRQAVKYTLDTTQQVLLNYESKLHFLEKIEKIGKINAERGEDFKNQALKILEDR